MAEKRSVTLLGVGDGCDVFSRHNQNVHGRLRIEIREGVAEIVLVNCFRRNTPVDYLAEDATHVKESTDVRQQLSWLETGRSRDHLRLMSLDSICGWDLLERPRVGVWPMPACD